VVRLLRMPKVGDRGRSQVRQTVVPEVPKLRRNLLRLGDPIQGDLERVLRIVVEHARSVVRRSVK